MTQKDPRELAEELWDKCSQHIDDSSSGFDEVAGISVAKEQLFTDVITAALSEKDHRIQQLEQELTSANRIVEKWNQLDEKIASYYPEDGAGEDYDLDDSDGLIGIGEAAASAFGYL